ncbi:MAG: hypothetical protein Q7R98_02020 [Candidatus Jorgensenbacteria bacterium]|nr:hypothetical protein [Candidatus Jorgensenbacteria bacterium]
MAGTSKAKEPLSAAEIRQCADLMERIPDGFIPPEIFPKWVGKFPSGPMEIIIFDEHGQVFMIPRPDGDKEYPGKPSHCPGTVQRPGETEAQAIRRAFKSGEGLNSLNVQRVIRICDADVMKGTGRGENPTRQERAVIWVGFHKGPFTGNFGGFYDPNHLPENTLEHHRNTLIPHAIAWMLLHPRVEI